MKLENDDIIDEDVLTINKREMFSKRIDNEDIKLSLDVPMVVRYDYIDLGQTPYHFKQPFTHDDTKGYFDRMHQFSGQSINKLMEHAREYHFYRSDLKGKLGNAIRKVIPNVDESQIVFHFSLYDSKEWANRDKEVRNSRVYFMLGTYGHVYILFFDPYHELNPMPNPKG